MSDSVELNCFSGKAPRGWICYPTDNADGYDVYTYSPKDSPVPAGVVTFTLTV